MYTFSSLKGSDHIKYERSRLVCKIKDESLHQNLFSKMYAVFPIYLPLPSFCVCVCVSVDALTAKSFDLRP